MLANVLSPFCLFRVYICMSCSLTWHKTFPLIYNNAVRLNVFGTAAVIDLERSAQICLRLSRNERQKKDKKSAAQLRNLPREIGSYRLYSILC